MYMRLGFAVAAHVEPDIVLVDEVLAVGDESFQQKCMARMQDLRREGRTIVFISHSMDAVASLCNRVMLLSHGEVVTVGQPKEVVTAYRTGLAVDRDRRRQTSAATSARGEVKDVELLAVRLRDEDGHECDTVSMGDTVRLECDYRANTRVENPAFGVTINRDDGLYIFGPNTVYDNIPVGPISGEGTFSITYHSLPLMQATYHFTVSAYQQEDVYNAIDSHSHAATLTVTSPTIRHGVVTLPHTWEVSGGEDVLRQARRGEKPALV